MLGFDFNCPISPNAIQSCMADHNDGIGSDESICVHDNNHRWETRSSSLIYMTKDICNVQYTYNAPCYGQWNQEVLTLR